MKSLAGTSDYLCAIERNQNGKYNVRIRAVFGGQAGWNITLYFLASSFNAAMKKLEESLQLLQKNEERLRFWSIERSDDPNVAGDLLEESGLWLDRRREFPRKMGRAKRQPRPSGSGLDACVAAAHSRRLRRRRTTGSFPRPGRACRRLNRASITCPAEELRRDQQPRR